MNELPMGLVEYLQAEQYETMKRLYAALNESSADPTDAFKKLACDELRAEYEQSVAVIQKMSGMGDACPCCICDCDLMQFASDMHKECYGFRYRGAGNVAEVKAMIESMHAYMRSDEFKQQMEAEREWVKQQEAEYNAYWADYDAEKSQQEALDAAYDMSHDHHDPRIQQRNQIVLSINL